MGLLFWAFLTFLIFTNADLINTPETPLWVLFSWLLIINIATPYLLSPIVPWLMATSILHTLFNYLFYKKWQFNAYYFSAIIFYFIGLSYFNNFITLPEFRYIGIFSSCSFFIFFVLILLRDFKKDCITNYDKTEITDHV